MGRPLTSPWRNEILANGTKAFVAAATSLRDMSDYELTGLSVPCLVYCGDLDPRCSGPKASVNHMPQAMLLSLPGLDQRAAIRLQAFQSGLWPPAGMPGWVLTQMNKIVVPCSFSPMQ